MEDNIKDFTVNWIILSLLLFSLMSFAITFMYNNNPGGLGASADAIFQGTSNNVSTKLLKTNSDADNILNITANTNPEASQLGSRDSVATAYSMKGTGTGFFESIKVFFSWIFTGEVGKMLISVFGGIFGFFAVYYIVKWVRNGF